MTLPVVMLPSSPPNPKSSMSSCTTIALPIIDLSPHRDIIESVMSIEASFPFSAWIFPRSPTCLLPLEFPGAPWLAWIHNWTWIYIGQEKKSWDKSGINPEKSGENLEQIWGKSGKMWGKFGENLEQI